MGLQFRSVWIQHPSPQIAESHLLAVGLSPPNFDVPQFPYVYYKDQSNTDISQVIAMMILKVNVYKALSIALQIWNIDTW